jgi:protein transport protein SEC31
MVKAEIKRTATIAFVPTNVVNALRRDTLFVATGTVAGALDASFSTSAELELFQLPFLATAEEDFIEAKKIGSISTQAR